MHKPTRYFAVRGKAYAFAAGPAIFSCACKAKDVVVAQVAPFGGPLAASGRVFNLGALIAFDQINYNGGVNGSIGAPSHGRLTGIPPSHDWTASVAGCGAIAIH